MNKHAAEAILRTQAVIITAIDALESQLLSSDPPEFDRMRRIYGKVTRRIWSGDSIVVNAPIEEAQNELR